MLTSREGWVYLAQAMAPAREECAVDQRPPEEEGEEPAGDSLEPAGTCPHCGRQHERERLCQADYEGWRYWELHEKEDYAGLVAHCEAVVDWQPGDPDALCALGFAHVLNGEPAKAIALLSDSHRRQPEETRLQRVILQALFAQGKDETDFDWVELMPVHRLDSSVLDRCHESVSSNYRLGHYTVGDLYCEISRYAYCVFTQEELLATLRRDERFAVEEEGDCDPGIRPADHESKESIPVSTGSELVEALAKDERFVVEDGGVLRRRRRAARPRCRCGALLEPESARKQP